MLKCKTIVEAQYHLSAICKQGYRQDVQHGEFANESVYRLQSKPVYVVISDPMNFFDLLPEKCGVSVADIEKYYFGLINPIKPEEADYSYGERIAVQLPVVMDMLKDTPQTNQAIIEIARPEDIFLNHKPCVRLIHFSVYYGCLNVTVFVRSNDIGSAFIINHGGFAMLLRDVAEYAGLPVGEYNYFSTGAHLYSHSLDGI